MNAKTMAAILEHMDDKTTYICDLTAKVRQYEDKFQALKDLVGWRSTSNGHSFEELLRSLVADRKLKTLLERDQIDLCSALDEVPLPKEDHESYAAFALRVSDAMRALKEDKSTLQKDLHEARLENGHNLSVAKGLQQIVANRDAQIAQLEKRESELNALHDTIESLPGFPMQPPETYAEYLQRLASDRKSLKIYNEDGSRALADERSKNQQLTDQLQNTCSNEELSEALRERDSARRELADALSLLESHKKLHANVMLQRDESETARDTLRRQWDASLKARDAAQDEALRTREINEAMQSQLTLRSQIIARVMMDPATDKLFNERDWSDAARKVLIDARALCGDNVTVQE